jgi:hypothetical protein
MSDAAAPSRRIRVKIEDSSVQFLPVTIGLLF